MAAQHPLSGKRYNGLIDEATTGPRSMYERMLDNMLGALHADGYPPFNVPNDPQQEYEELTKLRDANAPAYWLDKGATGRLAKLEQQFGGTMLQQPAPPPPQAAPMPPPMPMGLLG